MKILFIFILLSFPAVLSAQNTMRVQAGQDLQSIIDSAPAGSVVIVDPGTYGRVQLSKKITIIGAGAFATNLSIIESIWFNAGSDNSSVSGFKITGAMVSAIVIKNNVNNIFISRNFIPTGTFQTDFNNCSPNCGSNNGLTIVNNVINIILFNEYSPVNNFLIKNNIIKTLTMSSSSSAAAITGQIVNNTFAYFTYNGNVLVLDNGFILSCPGNLSSYVVFKNNIINQTNLGETDLCRSPRFAVSYNVIAGITSPHFNETNVQGVNASTLFTGFPTNISGELPSQYQLASSSPARGVGENGVDCGIYGGNDPFPILSIPVGPYIYELTAPSQVSSGQTLNVNVKARISN